MKRPMPRRTDVPPGMPNAIPSSGNNLRTIRMAGGVGNIDDTPDEFFAELTAAHSDPTRYGFEEKWADPDDGWIDATSGRQSDGVTNYAFPQPSQSFNVGDVVLMRRAKARPDLYEILERVGAEATELRDVRIVNFAYDYRYEDFIYSGAGVELDSDGFWQDNGVSYLWNIRRIRSNRIPYAELNNLGRTDIFPAIANDQVVTVRPDPDLPGWWRIVKAPGCMTAVAIRLYQYYLDGNGKLVEVPYYYVAVARDLMGTVATVPPLLPPPASLLSSPEDPVVADGGTFKMASGGSFAVPAPGVLAGALIPDDDSGEWWAEVVSGPSTGTLTYLDSDGGWRYVAAAGPYTDTFTFRLTNGVTNSDTATITIYVHPAEPAAVVNSSRTIISGQTLIESEPGALTGATQPYGYWAFNDTDPATGSLDYFNTDGSFRYQAAGGAYTDTFDVKLSNGTTTTAAATVTINVVAPPSFRPIRSRAGMARVRRNPTRTKIVRPITTSF